MKHENKNRSPLKHSPLRQSGQSLNEKMRDVFDDIMQYVTYILIFISLAINEWVRTYFHTPPQPLFLTLVTITVIIYFLIKIFPLWKEYKNLKLGRDGERIVGEALEDLREKGYKIFHSVVGKGFDIDHVLVGPGGVYTVETKTISKNGNQEISYDGIHVKIGGFIPDRDPVVQARAQMHWLEDLISERTKMKIGVKPVVTYPGWYIRQKTNNSDVWVLNEKSLLKYLNNENAILNSEQINLIAGHIESYIRNHKEDK